MKTKKGSFLICILIVSLLLSMNVKGQSAKKHYKAGVVYIESKKFEFAIDEFTKAVELDPDFAKAYIERGKLYDKAGNKEAAIEDFSKAVIFEPKNKELFYYLGKCYNEAGKYNKALVALNRATNFAKRELPPRQEKIKTLLALEKFERAREVADSALVIKDNSLNNYYMGVISVKLEELDKAEKFFNKSISQSRYFVLAHLDLADLYRNREQLDKALTHCNYVLNLDKKNIRAYHIRSDLYVKQLEYPNGINDISRIIILDTDNPKWYALRGSYYQQFNQHLNAINDYSVAISLDEKNPDYYFARAKSYEHAMNFASAAKDYETITQLSEYNVDAKKLLDATKARLFEINRENNKPEIIIVDPEPKSGTILELPGDKETFLLKGKVWDESDLDYLKINDKEVRFEKKENHYEFVTDVDIRGFDELVITALDVYDNKQTGIFPIKRTEVDPPRVKIITPFASDNNLIYLESNEPTLYIEGQITDESHIRSIFIEGVTASYRMNVENPKFSANIDIMNKNKFTVLAEDMFGNRVEKVFTLNREGSLLSENNPMGKTWVIFIENSKYEVFASLEGPVKDISLMKSSFAKYQIHNIITKQNMTKEKMEKFFSIELRDLLRSNHVNSLLVWYAGHGKFVNETGYWIPVDAKRDDEFTYYNINTLKAAMQSYSSSLTHTLVVTDACESGPTFYQAMRSTPKARSCDDWTATKSKSSQVFSSAGYELAVDNSQFTRTFANSLANNPNACIPIENIVSQVTIAVIKNNQQRPKFGKIAGLEDENGTFFFILK
ncbi:MAG: tetratricopeptide repeat protein [Bacteroidetes bacterium]|nr:tetratricopeptide repeat protein [Bacteroidota bacterium]